MNLKSRTKGSMTLFSLSFLFMFVSWIHINLDAHLKTLKAQENIKEIHERIDIEEDVFDMVRQGYDHGVVHNKANYVVTENILKIDFIGPKPKTHEYDIIGDGSFEWRKKYDSIE